MSKRIVKSSRARHPDTGDAHRHEHWYIDNQVYFITARCRDRFPAFASEAAKAVSWDRFQHWTSRYGFVPWVTSLLDNHYHSLEYLKIGSNLGPMMQKLHGSVSKLVNDLLPERRKHFFRDAHGREYFDGCLRDEKQGRRTFRYVYTQCRRHGICRDPEAYAHTHVNVELERAISRSLEIGAFLEGVPYKRYMKRLPGR